MADNNKLGRLKSLGIETDMQIALYLPVSYLDVSHVVNTYEEAFNASLNGSNITVQGNLKYPLPQPQYAPGQQPRLHLTMILNDGGEVGFTVFDTDKALKSLISKLDESRNFPFAVNGLPLKLGRTLKLNAAQIIDAQYVGRVLPVYKGKTKVIKPDTVREKILQRIDFAIPQAVHHLTQQLNNIDVSHIFDIKKLEMVMREVHLPSSINHANRANQILDLLAAEIAKRKVITHFKLDKTWVQSARINIHSRWQEVAQMAKFQLTGEQVQVIQEIANHLNKATPMRAMVMGDVGSGKTICFSVPAISAALEGKNVAIMLPNSSLAKQVYEEICGWIPEGRSLTPTLINSDTPKGVGEGSTSGKLLVGTSALLFRDFGRIDWMICDEQQKFSIGQREQLIAEGTHLLESSATPIPRSVALIKYGAMQVWQLKSNHTKKEIRSYLLADRASKLKLMDRVHHTLSVGNQAIIVYSLKDDSEAEGMENLVSAEKAYDIWDKKYPTQVRLVHSQMDNEQKEAALRDMKENRAKILISTTVIEVGVTIPSAHLLAVINAERHGLTGLHQLRGRLCRNGNKNGQFGEFLMLTKDNPSEKTLSRLSVMLETNDGYEVARHDMKQRGFGDLHVNGETQSGADDSVFIGRKVDIELMEKVV